MVTSLLLAAVAQSQPLTGPYRVEGVQRLALTPVMDGAIQAEEWDVLSRGAGGETYFQWEPGVLHFAAHAMPDQDVVVSMDMAADGWLVGTDNLEITYSLREGELRTRVRTLDATDPGGPVWRSGGISTEALSAIHSVSDVGWMLEASFIPNRSREPKSGRRMGVRVDQIPALLDPGESFLPRPMGFVILQMDASRNLLPGMSWRPVFESRSVARQDELSMRFRVNRDQDGLDFTQASFRAEGLAREEVLEGRMPFPHFRDDSSVIGYNTVIDDDAIPGWRVVQLALQNGDSEVLLRSSFRIANLVDLELDMPDRLRAVPEAQIIRGTVTIQSQFTGRVEGQFSFDAPAEWTVTRGKTDDFRIFHSRGAKRVPIEFVIPKNTYGTFPLTFRAQIGDELIERKVVLPIE